MRLLFLFLFIFLPSARAAAPFEIVEGDRVLLLGDTLLERENTFGYLETRMHEQFPDRHFTVRNLSWAGDTPRGVSRASFDPPEKGWERLKESIALVKPTVVFLGYGMAASLQEMTDRAQDTTLNGDEARYGSEPMTAARFKKELGELMEAIVGKGGKEEHRTSNVQLPTSNEQKAVPKTSERKITPPTSTLDVGSSKLDVHPVRFVLLSPIRHEDLRAVKPGLPDPAPHNALLEQYAKAIAEMAKEGKFGDLAIWRFGDWIDGKPQTAGNALTDNGIHLNAHGYELWSAAVIHALTASAIQSPNRAIAKSPNLRAAVLKKNELFFHRFRPENATYLFGFRKHEQGQNAKEIPMFDPLIEQAEAEIDKIKGAKSAAAVPPGVPAVPPQAAAVPQKAGVPPQTSQVGRREASVPPREPSADRREPSVSRLEPSADLRNASAPPPKGVAGAQNAQAVARSEQKAAIPAKDAPISPPLPDFTVQDGYQIALWAENPLLEKPTQMNWDAAGRLWVCSSSLYPQIEPGQLANDKILILEDTDRDGKADRSTIFADGLLIPTAVVPDFGEHPTSNVQHPTSKEEASNTPPREAPNSRLSTFPAACYVGQSTELLRFEDTDGDGKADTKRVVFSGFGTEDTHHLIHTLKWGPDGRLYWNQSIYIHSHLETPWGMVRLNSGGIFAYDPRTERVEVFAKGWCNPWGHAWDQWGQSFTTDGAGGQGISWVIPQAMYFTYENGRRIAPSISPGSYPKFASLELIHSPHFPDDWQGNAVTCDFRAHRIVRFSVEDLSTGPDAKSGYVTKEQPDLVRTSDPSFRPIDIRHGPDGALYVADWSNPVINHGEVDFRDPRRDKHMGRIWRISKKDAPVVKWEALVAAASRVAAAPPPQNVAAAPSPRELLEKLLSKSAWEQEQARRVVIAARGSTTPDRPAPAGLSLTDFLEWMGWTGRGGLTADERKAHAAAGIWRATQGDGGMFAIRVAGSQDYRIRAASAVHWANTEDPSPRVRTMSFSGKTRAILSDYRYVLLAEQELEKGGRKPEHKVEVDEMWKGVAEGIDLILRAALNSPGESGAVKTTRAEEKGGQFDKPTFSDTKDPLYGYAAWLSINDLAKPWTDAIASGAWKADTDARAQQLAWGLKAIDPALAGATLARLVTENKVPLDGTGPWIELLGTAGGAKELQPLWDGLLVSFAGDCCETDETRALAGKAPHFDEPTGRRAAAALLTAARLRNATPPARTGLAPVLFHATPVQEDALRLSGLWKAPTAIEKIGELLEHAETTPAARRAAIEALRTLGSREAMTFLDVLTRPAQPPAIRSAALVAITQVKLDAGIVKAADVLPALTDEALSLETWRGLLAVKDAPDAFAARLPKELPKSVAAAGVRAAREAGKSGAKLLAALTPLAGLTDAEARMPQDFKALAAFTKQNGDPARGELIYRRAALGCTVCHAIGGAGGKVGPDMTSLGASAPLDYIIESTLAPALKVKEGYNAVTLTLKDGTQATGIQARETGQEVFLRDVTGREQAIAKAQIAGTTNVGSIMPAGMTDALQDRERLDLFAFLGELGKPGPYDASKGTVARVWKLFSGADAAKVIAPETPMDTGFPGYTLVDGRFVKELLEAAAPLVTNGADTLMAVTQFQSTGKTRLKITGAGKAWLDGKPLALSEDLAPELSAGVHTLAVKLDVKTLPAHLRAESPDARFLGN